MNYVCRELVKEVDEKPVLSEREDAEGVASSVRACGGDSLIASRSESAVENVAPDTLRASANAEVAGEGNEPGSGAA